MRLGEAEHFVVTNIRHNLYDRGISLVEVKSLVYSG